MAVPAMSITGILPVEELPIIKRVGANLPHWTKTGGTYATTFRLSDSLPTHVAEAWRREREEIVQRAASQNRILTWMERKELQQLYSDRVESVLNRGEGSCWMKNAAVARIVQDVLRFFHGQRYEMYAWAVMPNHVHAVFRPLGEYDLSGILHSWKSFTSKQANKLLGRTGQFWQDEYYDHLVRNEEDFMHSVNYVINNPARAGLENWQWVGMQKSEIRGVLNPEVQEPHGVIGHEDHGQDARVTHGRDAHATCSTLDITVLMGGPSSEREVSLLSGEAIACALERNGHKVTRSDISPTDVSALKRKGIDVVFIALHGAFGESGEVQALCEEHGLRYIGSPAKASEMAMNKATAKEYFRKAGLNIAEGFVVHKTGGGAGHLGDPATKAQIEKLGLPLVIKPVDGGSSVDVVIARTAADRDAELSRLVDKYGCMLVEQFIAGRELTVGILGDQALPVIEIVPDGSFYDYRAKYSDQAQTRYVFDHGIAPEIVQSIQRNALAAHRSLGCRDMSRVDFILTPAGKAYVLEINTIPGFTSHSLLPKAAAKVGVSFEQLVERIARMAMAR
jgi:D-alanine--D-alanine ligase